jgi:hypothetical protein
MQGLLRSGALLDESYQGIGLGKRIGLGYKVSDSETPRGWHPGQEPF